MSASGVSKHMKAVILVSSFALLILSVLSPSLLVEAAEENSKEGSAQLLRNAESGRGLGGGKPMPPPPPPPPHGKSMMMGDDIEGAIDHSSGGKKGGGGGDGGGKKGGDDDDGSGGKKGGGKKGGDDDDDDGGKKGGKKGDDDDGDDDDGDDDDGPPTPTPAPPVCIFNPTDDPCVAGCGYANHTNKFDVPNSYNLCKNYTCVCADSACQKIGYGPTCAKWFIKCSPLGYEKCGPLSNYPELRKYRIDDCNVAPRSANTKWCYPQTSPPYSSPPSSSPPSTSPPSGDDDDGDDDDDSGKKGSGKKGGDDDDSGKKGGDDDDSGKKGGDDDDSGKKGGDDDDSGKKGGDDDDSSGKKGYGKPTPSKPTPSKPTPNTTYAPTVKGATNAPTVKGATSAPTPKGATSAPTTKRTNCFTNEDCVKGGFQFTGCPICVSGFCTDSSCNMNCCKLAGNSGNTVCANGCGANPCVDRGGCTTCGTNGATCYRL